MSKTALVLLQGSERLTTTRIVAEHFRREHKSVIRALENLRLALGEERFSRCKFAPRAFTDSRGKTHVEFMMDEPSFAILAMGFTGAEAACLRQDFVEAFERLGRNVARMIRRAPEWKAARRDVADHHRIMADVLVGARQRDGKTTEMRHFANEARLLTFALTGQAQPPVDRNSLSADELVALGMVERLNTRLIAAGKSYTERKAACRVHAVEQFAKLALPMPEQLAR